MTAPEPVDPWETRPVLAHVRDFARARMVGPYALLGALLVRAAAATGPGVVLPPVVGGQASLNLLVAMVGKSGGGKGAADAAARAATNLPDTPEYPLGSGEGIARTFAPPPPLRGKGDPSEQDAPPVQAIFTASEVDGLAAVASRRGSTLLPVLRSMWSGETLGAANAQAHTRVSVPAHSYRACLTVGVQPEAAGPLLHDLRGTAQRFVWLPVGDPEPPEVLPPEPPAFQIRNQANVPPWMMANRVLELPEVARAAMIDHRRAVLRGDDVNPLDGHAMLTRAKLAAAFMVLDGRMGTVTADDWDLAGWLMGVSNRTRSSIERDLSEGRRRANQARALATVEHDDELDRRRLETVKRRVVAVVERGRVSRGKLRAALGRKEYRDLFELAAFALEAEGVIHAENHGPTTFYTAGDGLNIEHPVQSSKSQVIGNEQGLNIEPSPPTEPGRRHTPIDAACTILDTDGTRKGRERYADTRTAAVSALADYLDTEGITADRAER